MEQVTQCFATDTHTPKMLHDIITDARAWIQASVSPTNWLMPFPAACIVELDQAVQAFDRYPPLIQNLTIDRFPNLPICRDITAQVRTRLRHHTGNALDHRVRRSVANLEQPFHTDGPYLSITPEIAY